MCDALVFVKFGGSLITDKQRRETPHRDVLQRLAKELQAARETDPALRIVLGHGSGSFGHWEASRHNTQDGVHTAEEWRGFARVSAAASRLNRIVTDTLLDAGVPVLSLQPSASALAESGEIVAWALDPIRRAIAHDLVPLIFGDVAFDRAQGGTILSTEMLLAHLATQLQPRRVLLLGNAPGVLDDRQQLIPRITPESYPAIARFLRGSDHVDVTGGMADKVEQMLALVQHIDGLRVWILTGREPGNLYRALLAPQTVTGTCIEIS
ncbi:MAG: isopentenyl phosphate kinase [Anaerolineae bacterium]